MRRHNRARMIFAYLITAPFMLVGSLAYIAKVGYRAGWAWAEHLLERYL